MKYVLTSLVLFVVVLSGCTSLSKDASLVSEDSESTSTIMVYRPAAFYAGGVSLFVGIEDAYFMKLGNSQYAETRIEPGEYVIQAKANGGRASELSVSIEPDEAICLIGKPNSGWGWTMLIPLAASFIPTFMLEEATCPDEEVLASYRRFDL